jgi:mevalonate kinase
VTWSIPAKTFFLGEYAAVAGHAAIVLTTTPSFMLHRVIKPGLQGIHIDSPAGQFWSQHAPTDWGCSWEDPYLGLGGLGASSAQFLGVYRALGFPSTAHELLTQYQLKAWTGVGLKPSGYDVLAQAQGGVTYLNHHGLVQESLGWPFHDLGFILVHTAHKLATHKHLQDTTLPSNVADLSAVVDRVRTAFITQESQVVIEGVLQYQQLLETAGLMAVHTQQMIAAWKYDPTILAMKGCGALGADVILVLAHPEHLPQVRVRLEKTGARVLATDTTLFQLTKKECDDCC